MLYRYAQGKIPECLSKQWAFSFNSLYRDGALSSGEKKLRDVMRAIISTTLEFITHHAASQKARLVLYVFSALESIIIPIPVDPYLAACVLARPQSWVRISALTAFASVLGGAVGWYLGFALQDVVAQAALLLPDNIAGEAVFSKVSDAFMKLGLMLVLIGAFTPLPFKIIAISAGLFGYGLLPFLILSAIGRGARFLLVGGLIAYRRDVRMVTSLASLILLLICAGLYFIA